MSRLRPPVVGVALLLAACGGAPPEPAGPVPALPAGRLQLVGTGAAEARYVALDDLQWTNGLAQVTVLLVARSAMPVTGRAALTVKRETVNCGARMIANEVAAHFDFEARPVGSEALTGPAGRLATGADAETAVLCDRQTGPVVTGFRAAQREIQAPPPQVEARAQADPGDAAAWAWLCSGAARSKDSTAGVAACDRAVALAPQDVRLKLDRGYLKLLRRDEVGADADFQAVLERDPRDPSALYGRSLILALRGQTAASDQLQAQARGLDPKVAEAVADTYGVPVAPAGR